MHHLPRGRKRHLVVMFLLFSDGPVVAGLFSTLNYSWRNVIERTLLVPARPDISARPPASAALASAPVPAPSLFFSLSLPLSLFFSAPAPFRAPATAFRAISGGHSCYDDMENNINDFFFDLFALNSRSLRSGYSTYSVPARSRWLLPRPPHSILLLLLPLRFPITRRLTHTHSLDNNTNESSGCLFSSINQFNLRMGNFNLFKIKFLAILFNDGTILFSSSLIIKGKACT